MNTALSDLLENSFSIIKEKLNDTLHTLNNNSQDPFDLVEVIQEVQFLEGVLTGADILNVNTEKPK